MHRKTQTEIGKHFGSTWVRFYESVSETLLSKSIRATKQSIRMTHENVINLSSAFQENLVFIFGLLLSMQQE